MITLIRRARRSRRGAAVVEFAVVTPLLLLIVIGAIQIGYVLMARQNVILAARAGARAASLKNATMSDVTTTVDAAMYAAHLTGYTTTSNLSSLGSTDTTVWVKVSLPYSAVSLTGNFIVGNSFDIQSEVTMRREGLRDS